MSGQMLSSSPPSPSSSSLSSSSVWLRLRRPTAHRGAKITALRAPPSGGANAPGREDTIKNHGKDSRFPPGHRLPVNLLRSHFGSPASVVTRTPVRGGGKGRRRRRRWRRRRRRRRRRRTSCCLFNAICICLCLSFAFAFAFAFWSKSDACCGPGASSKSDACCSLKRAATLQAATPAWAAWPPAYAWELGRTHHSSHWHARATP